MRISIEIGLHERPEMRRTLGEVPVDSNSCYSWLPADQLVGVGIQPIRTDRLEVPGGGVVDRQVGFGMIHLAGRTTVTAFVFAHPGDPIFVGFHALTGLGLEVDPVLERLVLAGPHPAAVAA